jgi:transcriptional regulator with XRE-family HTH domain
MLLSESTVRNKLVGEELRRYREAAGLKLAEACPHVGLDPSQLSRLENGKRPPKCEDVAGLLAVYGIRGAERRQLLELARAADQPGFLQRNSLAQRVTALKILESRAIRLINFECSLVPGLLQTVPYIQALMRNVGLINDEEVIGERVANRVHRQGVLRKAGPPHFLAIIAERALHNVIGDNAIMVGQIDYLIEAAQRPNISIRVIPDSASNHPGFEGPFLRLQFHDRRGVVVLTNRTSSLYLENDEDLVAYDTVMVELLTMALGDTDSVALLGDLRTRLA